MTTDPNYPDDIRRFDDDPRSPFYVEKFYCQETTCGDPISEDAAMSTGLCGRCESAAEENNDD